MSEDAEDVTSETPAEEAVATEEPVAETVEEPAADETPAAEPVAEAQAEEPVADTSAEADAVEDSAEIADDPAPVYDAEETEIVAAPTEAFGPVRVARVYVCERGHRTTTLWGQPDTCQAQPLRSGPQCGLKLYHITELPEQVQKALNPLKASKKASKKK